MAHEAGKGSAQRPTNHQAFSDAFDRIFGTTSRQFDHIDANDTSEEPVDEDEENEHEYEICVVCNGSGEGMHDGSSCKRCGGTGEDRGDLDEIGECYDLDD